MKLALILTSCVALAGCKLIDQTTFAPSPEPPVTIVAPPVDPRTPLLTVGYDSPTPSYQEPLRFAIRTAEARAPNVQYEVVALLPAGGDLAQAQGNASEIMRAIMAERVPASRIHLNLRVIPAGSPRQVRVYVRA